MPPFSSTSILKPWSTFLLSASLNGASQVAQWLRILLPMQDSPETQVQSLGQEDLLEEEMVTHSNILAWEIPWTEQPEGLQSMGSQRVGHDRTTEHTCRDLVLP